MKLNTNDDAADSVDVRKCFSHHETIEIIQKCLVRPGAVRIGYNAPTGGEFQQKSGTTIYRVAKQKLERKRFLER